MIVAARRGKRRPQHVGAAVTAAHRGTRHTEKSSARPARRNAPSGPGRLPRHRPLRQLLRRPPAAPAGLRAAPGWCYGRRWRLTPSPFGSRSTRNPTPTGRRWEKVPGVSGWRPSDSVDSMEAATGCDKRRSGGMPGQPAGPGGW